MLKKLVGILILAALIFGVASPALAAPTAAPAAPAASDLLNQLSAGDQVRTTARNLALEAQRLQAVATTVKGVYDAAQKTASDALVAAQTADATARGSLPSFVTVVAQPTLSATWAPIAQLLPGNGLVQAALSAARTAESAQSVANTKATEHQTAQTAATEALQNAIAAMPSDPAIATATARADKAESDVVQLRKDLAAEKARVDRAEGRVDELTKKLTTTPAPAAPAATVAPTASQLQDMAGEAAREKTAREKAETEIAALRKQLAVAITAATPAPAATAPATTAATPATPAAPAPAVAPAVAPAAAAPAAVAPSATPAAPVAPSVTAAPAVTPTPVPAPAPAAAVAPAATAAPVATAPAAPEFVTKKTHEEAMDLVGRIGSRLVAVEETAKDIKGLKADIAGLRGDIDKLPTKLEGMIDDKIKPLIVRIETLSAKVTTEIENRDKTISTLRGDLGSIQRQLVLTWISLGGLLGLGLLIAAAVGVRRLWVARRIAREQAEEARRAAATAAGAGGTPPTIGTPGGAHVVT